MDGSQYNYVLQRNCTIILLYCHHQTRSLTLMSNSQINYDSIQFYISMSELKNNIN